MRGSKNKIFLEKIKGKTVFVTGGSGFIGKHLVRLLNEYCDVIVLSRKTKIKGQKTAMADITDNKALLNSVKKFDFDLVFHVAGNTVTPHRTNDLDHFSINAIGTKNILELCQKKEVNQIIYSSSMEVYGNPLYFPVDETHPKIPVSYYGLSKLMGEHYCHEYFKQYGICSTILRYSYVYGPGLPDYRAIPLFIMKAFANEPLHLHNKGTTSTDYVFVKDVSMANILAASNEKAKNQVLNIGSGNETSIEELANSIIKIIGSGTILKISGGMGIPKKFVLDITKAKKILKFYPMTSLPEGLKKQIDYIITSKS